MPDVSIVGVGQSDFGQLYAQKDEYRDSYGLAAAALREALEDAGLHKDELDGLICSRIKYGHLATTLGMRTPKVVYELEASGRMSGAAVNHAVALVQSGAAETIALVYGNNGRSSKMVYGGGEGSTPVARYESMYGMTSVGASAAMMFRRYMHEFGAPEDALAPIAVTLRSHAALNPVAVMRDQFTVDEYRAARFVAEPLRLLDYCIVNDGGAALIITTTERARDLRHRPVRIAATATRADLGNYYQSPDFFYSACQDVAHRVYTEAGLGPNDMDCLQVYDNFTPTILFSLEGFGHAERGTAWEWVGDGRIGLGGERPVNTSGGHISESYMQGWALHVEAVRQIRGTCGDRQVPNCNTVQYQAASPIVSSHILVGE